jgi:hypothetical protein
MSWDTRGFRVERLRYLFRKIRAGLLALDRIRSCESIKLSSALYFRVPKPEVQLCSLALESGEVFKLSIADTRKIFISIMAACDANERRDVELRSANGSVTWITDCRVEKHGYEYIGITVKDGWTIQMHSVRREDVQLAAMEFSERFG